jgi:hypothetical protein
LAIAVPLFTFAPKLYAWFLQARMAKLYRRLRAVDANLRDDLTAVQGAALQSDLEAIDRAASILPLRHSDMFFALHFHIDRTRVRLERRLIELRS